MNNFLLFALVEFIATFFALIYLLNIKVNKQKIISIIFFIVLPTLCVYTLIGNWLGIITLFTTTAILFYIFAKNYRVLLDICSVFIGGILTTHLVQYINNYFFNMKSFSYSIIHALLFILIFTVFVYSYKLVIESVFTYLSTSIIIQILIFSIASITIFVFYLNIFIPTNRNEVALVKINLFIQIGYFTLMVILFSLLLYGLRKEIHSKQNKLEFEHFLRYMESLEQVNRDMQKFRHDYSNILLTIHGYLEAENIYELKQYFQKHIVKTEQHTLFKNRVLGNLENLQIIGLKGLLSTKALQADKNDIKINIEIPNPIYRVDIEIIDLTRVLGILMDNAIEASSIVEQREINLALLKINPNSVIIIIRNKIEDTTINITQLFNEKFSTKGDGRGYGLGNARSILHHYPNVTMNTRIDKKWFIQEIEIRGRQ